MMIGWSVDGACGNPWVLRPRRQHHARSYHVTMGILGFWIEEYLSGDVRIAMLSSST